MPDGTTDAAGALSDATWSRFCAAPHLLGPTPGHRAQWAAGRVDYAVWAVRLTSEAVSQRIAALQALLGDWMHAIPPADFHITTWVAGFPTHALPTRSDDISEADLERQAATLARHPPFRLGIGGANSFTTASFLEVIDLDGTLASLRNSLTRTGPPELRFAPYIPHVTLGTATGNHPTAAIQACLQPHRQLPLIEVQVSQVEEVRFDARQSGAPLHTHRTVHLS